MNLQDELRQFTGTEHYTRWSYLFPRMVLTDGAKYLAQKGECFWLMDAIASHQPECLKHEALRYIQFWTLTKHPEGNATLKCFEDSGLPPVVTQEIPYTDFPLDTIKLYVQTMGDGHYCIMLPSEY
jgi:hypothetical protein